MDYAADTNILLRYATPADPQHTLVRAAVSKIKARGDGIVICGQNIIEFWNVATRPATRNGFGLTPAQADYQAGQLELLFPMLPDTAAIYTAWRQIVVAAGVSGVQVHDARIAAVLQVYAIPRLLTLNVSDFTRYSHLQALHPQDILNQP